VFSKPLIVLPVFLILLFNLRNLLHKLAELLLKVLPEAAVMCGR
jgi:hypothetical protein